MSTPPFCVDCTHRSKLLGSDMCNRITDEFDLTTGNSKVLYRLCSIERMEPRLIIHGVTCGTDGKFFQQNISMWYRIKKWVSNKFS